MVLLDWLDGRQRLSLKSASASLVDHLQSHTAQDQVSQSWYACELPQQPSQHGGLDYLPGFFHPELDFRWRSCLKESFDRLQG